MRIPGTILLQAAKNDHYYDPASGTYKGGFVINAEGEKEAIKGRSSFIMKKKVKVYPIHFVG